MEKKWWHNKSIYQIYPKSFMDSNNDGIGDIPGIIQKLDYLKLLGVDILWLTPFFTSPMEDNGYDVANYKDVNPIFGTMKDMENLIEECKKRNMYIMMDIVANHTSSAHQWFQESKKSKENPYRNYYIWRDEKLPAYQSCFGGSAWQYDEKTNQYYFHEFGVGQPDLNWENPVILEEIASCINFWMDKGIKGIRFDVIHMIGKEIDHNILSYGPTLHEKVKKLAEKSYQKYDAITVGEAWGTLQNAIDFTNPINKELDLVFQFECTSSTVSPTKLNKFAPIRVNMKKIKDILCKYQEGLNSISWNTLFVENHDLGRCINKFGNVNYRVESAKAIATMNYFLKGIPFIYQGQELGMCNLHVSNLNEYDDLEIKGSYQDFVIKENLLTLEEFLDACNQEGRDNNRSPMQWDDSINAGFNIGHKTWLKVNDNYTYINAKNELNDPNSIFNYYQKILQLRKDSIYTNCLVYGTFKSYLDENQNVFVYERKDQTTSLLVVVNMNKYVENVKLPFKGKCLVLSNYIDTCLSNVQTLRPYESFVMEY